MTVPVYSFTGSGGLLNPGNNPSAGFMPGYNPAYSTLGGQTPQSFYGNGLVADPAQQGIGGLFGKIFGTLGSEGFQSGVSAFGNLANIYAGFKSLGLAEDQLDFAKSSFNRNFSAQAKSYNNELKDRWEARQAGASARGRNYETMGSWLQGRTIDEG